MRESREGEKTREKRDFINEGKRYQSLHKPRQIKFIFDRYRDLSQFDFRPVLSLMKRWSILLSRLYKISTCTYFYSRNLFSIGNIIVCIRVCMYMYVSYPKITYVRVSSFDQQLERITRIYKWNEWISRENKKMYL